MRPPLGPSKLWMRLEILPTAQAGDFDRGMVPADEVKVVYGEDLGTTIHMAYPVW